ncbi:MAG: cell envelope integrity protein TolA, partial [Burkholderiales bacterium]
DSDGLDFTQAIRVPPKAPSAPKPPPVDLAAAARADAERKAKEQQVTDYKARQEAEAKAKAEAEAKARAAAAEARARAEAEARARAEAEAKAKAKAEAEARTRADADAKVKAAREAAVRMATEAKARAEADARAKTEAAEKDKARLEAELNAKLEAERKAREEQERKRREEEDRRRKEEDERRAKEEAERRAREEADRKKREEEERKRREEDERRRKEDEERRAREDAERKKREEEEVRRRKEEEERRAKEEVDRRKREEEEARRRRDEEEKRTKDEAQRRARDEADRKKREDEDRKRREDDERRAREAAASLPKIETVAPPPPPAAASGGGIGDSLLADLDSFGKREEEEQREREEAERKAKAEAERKAKEEAERRAKEEAEKKRRDEEERRRKEEEKRRVQEEAERKAREEEGRLEEEEAERKREAKEAQAAKQAEERAAKAAAAKGAARRVSGDEDDIPVTEDDLDTDDLKRDQKVAAEKARRAAREAPPVAVATGGRPKKWGKPVAIVLFVLLIAGVGVLNFMPVSTAEYEKAASDAMGVPVKIGAGRLSVFTGIEVKLENVSIGSAVKIRSVRGAPEVGSLFGARKAFSRVELEGVQIAQSQVGEALLGKVAGENFRIGRVTVKQLALDGPLKLPPLDVDATVAGDGTFQTVRLSGADKLSVTLQPKGSDIGFEIAAPSFAPPFVPALSLAEFSMKGTANRAGVVTSEFDGRAFDGVLHGTARIRWGDSWTVEGEVKPRNLKVAVFAPTLVSEGRVEGRAAYSMTGSSPGSLYENARLQGEFKIEKGVLGSFDLARALQTGGAQSGGRTVFNEMTGQGVYDKGAMQFTNVAISAGGLNAGASLNIDTSGNLSGRIVADVKTTSQKLSATLTVSGKVQDPVIRK